MFTYQIKLAWRSIMRTPTISILTVVAIALGISVSTTTIGILHIFSGDPLPSKSDRLFYVRVDSWETGSEFFGIRPGDPPKHITYQDMTRLRASDIPMRDTAVANAAGFVFPEGDILKPYQTHIRLCHSDFFAMFNAPFKYGSAWDDKADQDREQVVILSSESNEKLFGGADSVGQRVRIGNLNYLVVGVLEPWPMTPRGYDLINASFRPERDFFIPFDCIRIEESGISRQGDNDNFGSYDRNDPQAVYTSSELHWLGYWVEMDPARHGEYISFLDRYSDEQRALGRFPRPNNNRAHNMTEWIEVRGVVPDTSKGMAMISLLFLLVCSLNLMGLLLGKFLAQSGLVGIHRALGAPKKAVFLQHIMECQLVGTVGGFIGILMAMGGLDLINTVLPSSFSKGFFHLDATMILVALGLSLTASLIAGVYPAWRACNVAPALQLKVQ